MSKIRYWILGFVIMGSTMVGSISVIAQGAEDVGIDCDQEQMINGQCSFNIYKTLGIRKADADNTSVGLFVQDTILSATMFIGTVVTIAIVVSGLMFVFSGANGRLKEKALNGLVNSVIGLLLVLSSYVIIRLIQFLVKGG